MFYKNNIRDNLSNPNFYIRMKSSITIYDDFSSRARLCVRIALYQLL